MKNRNRQRLNRRLKEELVSLRDSCGVKDPTPYEAVRSIIREFRKSKERRKSYGIFTNVN